MEMYEIHYLMTYMRVYVPDIAKKILDGSNLAKKTNSSLGHLFKMESI